MAGALVSLWPTAVLAAPTADPFPAGHDDPRAIAPEAAVAITAAPEQRIAVADPGLDDVDGPAGAIASAAPQRSPARAAEPDGGAVRTSTRFADSGPRWQLHGVSGIVGDTVTMVGASVGLGVGLLWPARRFGVDLRGEFIPLFGTASIAYDCGLGSLEDDSGCPPNASTGLGDGRVTLNARLGGTARNTFFHAIVPLGLRMTTVWEEESPVGGAVPKRERQSAFYLDGGAGFGLIRRLRRSGLIGFELTHRVGGRVSDHKWSALKPRWRFSTTALFFIGALL